MKTNGIKWIENGQVNLFGDALELFNQLDLLFQKLASLKTSKHFKFPNFIQAKELNKLDYFKSFPHLINFPVNLKNEDINLKSFVNGKKFDVDSNKMELTEINSICDCLTPAACYHFYIHFQNTNHTQPLYLTTLANCYRKEEYYEPLRRLWNFSMREIVCIGTAEEVKDFILFYKQKVSEIFKKLNIDINWDMATDPFFDPTNSPKFLMQSIDPVKFEMIYKGDLSIGSTNFHRTYFGETFSITRNDEPVNTGCVAFGMERWIFAILDTYGEDKANWPNISKIIEELK